ncbi:TetR/AcrR family transcriptional regulator [Halalkalibacterium ligniniphilum]|uniref:TetR/AcrR family transcriptional regulator n=1 Tax=Halalkalibacterium ligniniphilum TaxID=1134413 RepID=UPI00034AF10C|nr:TetR/AcrR family transcriptional regulator [Halalkalibacterium ligniniphilum]
MSPRVGLNRNKVLMAAAEIVDRDGIQGLTVSGLATHLNVRPPSLYNHIISIEHLEQELAVRGLKELATRLRAAATKVAELEALTEMANAYRSYAVQHPGLYTLSIRDRRNNPEYVAAGAEIIDVVQSVLKGYGLSKEKTIHAARCLRSAIHGFVSIELAGGFGMPYDLNESYTSMIQILHQGLQKNED